MHIRYLGCLVLAACLALAACAQSPEYIDPIYVSDVPYRTLSCEQLGADQTQLADALAKASAAQSSASTNDAVGVLLLGLPIGSMVGENRAAEIGRLKGELEAVQTALQTKTCTGPGSPPPVSGS
jgi:hypothetical protein